MKRSDAAAHSDGETADDPDGRLAAERSAADDAALEDWLGRVTLPTD